MSLTRTQYRDYVLAQSDDRQRQAISHRHSKSHFSAMIERILDEYELGEQFQAALAGQRPRLKILEVGCSEGLYLHDVAELLEKRGGLKAAYFYGIDIDMPSIETAIQYSDLSSPPRPYLNFLVHDLRQPLEEQPGLFEDGQPYFDFIYARQVLGLIPQAHQNLLRLYQALAPGGVIYLNEYVSHEGETDGWWAPHPAFAPLLEAQGVLLRELNQGIEVAEEEAGWLRQAGATLVQAIPHKIVEGGETRPGMDALRALLLVARNIGMHVVAQRRMSQTQVDQLLGQLYQELGPHCLGHLSCIDTLARKPLS